MEASPPSLLSRGAAVAACSFAGLLWGARLGGDADWALALGAIACGVAATAALMRWSSRRSWIGSEPDGA